MCPLRYVLLLLSLIIAAIGLTQALNEAQEIEEVEKKKEQAKNSSSFTSFLRTLRDMLTGRYLYDAWKNTVKKD